MTFSGVLEVLSSTFNMPSRLVVKSSMPSLVVGLSPFGLEESFISVSNIIEFIREFIREVDRESNREFTENPSESLSDNHY